MRSEVWRRGPASATVILSVVLFSTIAIAQQPGRPRDPTPFVRPQPIVVVSTTNPRNTLAELIDIVRGQRFEVSTVDWDKGEVLAVRKDSETREDADQVLIWIERDLANPTAKLKVFFLYARFEKFFGSAEGAVRVKIDQTFEQRQIGGLKTDITQYALRRG